MPLLSAMSDDGIYLVGAKSLAEGAGYHIQSLPRQPYQTKYPPLYSWLLSWIWKASPGFPSNLPVAAFFAWALLPAFLGLCWILLRISAWGIPIGWRSA